MNILKKSIKSIIALGLCLTAVLTTTAIGVSAAEAREIQSLHYRTPITDCEVVVYATEGGNVECIGASSGFLMESGTRKYEAIPNDGYKFDGWTYKLLMNDENQGNRKSLGRYTFSRVGSKKAAYNGKDSKIQLNRLSTCGENCMNALIYKATANFSKVDA